MNPHYTGQGVYNVLRGAAGAGRKKESKHAD